VRLLQYHDLRSTGIAIPGIRLILCVPDLIGGLAKRNDKRFSTFFTPIVLLTNHLHRCMPYCLMRVSIYYCSIRTMYRILEAHGEVRERRNQLRHPNYKKPELLAAAPNEVWSWDITKLRGPVKWTYFYPYVILDIFSRYVVGWMVAHRESAELAKRLISETCRKQDIEPDQLTIHADRGSSMRSKSVALLLSDLGITKTHSRPYVSNDNPYSEAQFKTLKYQPEFPDRFGSIRDSRSFCRPFFNYYNTEHRHSGIGLMTPEAVHYGRGRRDQYSKAGYTSFGLCIAS